MPKRIRSWTRAFALLTGALVLVYFIGTWFEDYSGATWIVPADWVIIGAIISAAITIICYIKKK